MTKRWAPFVLAAALCGAAIGWSCGAVEHRSAALVEAVWATVPDVRQRTWLGQPSPAPLYDPFVDTWAARCRSPRVLHQAVNAPRWTWAVEFAEFTERLSVRRVGRTHLIEIAFLHPDPRAAHRAVELVTDIALDAAREASNGDAGARIDALRLERERLQTEYWSVRTKQRELSEELASDDLEARQSALAEQAERLKERWLTVDRRLRSIQIELPEGPQPPLRLIAAAQVATEPATDSRPARAGLGAVVALVLAGGASVVAGRRCAGTA